jgi:glucose/arabinose dehydrogenase
VVRLLAGLAVIILLGGGAPTTIEAQSPFQLDLVPIAAKFRSPVFVADPGDGTGRVFVVEQRGVVKIVRDGVSSKHPFLNMQKLVEDSGAEQGLLSLAFHPDYARNGTFFVAYTEPGNALVVASFTVPADQPNRADPESHRVLLRIAKEYDEHNGGLVSFGPDGYLYISVGDGGRAAEPDGYAQRLDTLLGKLLRIDVDHPGDELAYGIPPDNPFAGVPGARPEIWAYGLRNPWRFSFDRETGDLFIADVGSGGPEEVDVQLAGSPGGENYGWNVFEGPTCHQPNVGEQCDGTGMVEPVWGYEHPAPEDGCAIVGGHVYRGADFPELVGAYLTADVCTGRVWAVRQQEGLWRATVLFQLDSVVSSFAEDSGGELYLISLRGHVYRLVRGTGSVIDTALAFSCLPASTDTGGWECQRATEP